jgi:hypothetical protein
VCGLGRHTQPLKLIAGKPMIYHTYTNANSSPSVRVAPRRCCCASRRGIAGRGREALVFMISCTEFLNCNSPLRPSLVQGRGHPSTRVTTPSAPSGQTAARHA